MVIVTALGISPLNLNLRGVSESGPCGLEGETSTLVDASRFTLEQDIAIEHLAS